MYFLGKWKRWQEEYTKFVCTTTLFFKVFQPKFLCFWGDIANSLIPYDDINRIMTIKINSQSLAGTRILHTPDSENLFQNFTGHGQASDSMARSCLSSVSTLLWLFWRGSRMLIRMEWMGRILSNFDGLPLRHSKGKDPVCLRIWAFCRG